MFARSLGFMAIVFCLVSSPILADDSQTNSVARKIKAKVARAVNKYKKPLSGYCDLTIEMEHKGKFAYIERIRTSGDHKLCKVGKKSIKKGMRFRYKKPERFIRIHIVQK